MLFRRTCLLVALLGCFAAPVAAAAPAATAGPAAGSASLLLAKVQDFYDRTADLSAGFEQTLADPIYGTNTVKRGKLKVKKPGLMVWDYAEREDADFYADGNKVQIVEHATRQVTRTDVSTSDFAGAVAFLFGGRKLITEFKVRHARGEDARRWGLPRHKVIELMPRKPSVHYKRLFLVLDASSGQVDSFVIKNGNDSINRFVLSEVKVNGNLAEADLRLKVPSGFVVADG